MKKTDSVPGRRAARLAWLLLLLSSLASAQGCDAPVYTAEVVNAYPHDANAFTQGLVFHDGYLYEGTGLNGQSSLRRVALEDGEVLQRHNLSRRYFGEGITILDNRIYQLTWRANTGFIYALDDFSLQQSFYLPGEGWGITHDGEHLIVSDGSAWLRFLDPQTQQEVRRVQVHDAQGPVDRLNELEYIQGEVWANVWYEDYIVRIDPASGKINCRVDLSGLQAGRGTEAVLNGIAWDEQGQRVFVTGKLWPSVYHIRINE